ncbi:MAG TPA: hypothetical protein VF020_21360 [Chthoniobacterales bacterium]
MKKVIYQLAIAGLGLSFCAITNAKEIQFTTLPEVVRTTVIHHYNVVSPEKVVRVVEEPDNIYQVTVVTDSGDQIVYVTADGRIVERPGSVVESREGSTAGEVTITWDEIQSGGERYGFVQDQGPDAIYIDHQTNKRVLVKGAAGKTHGGGAVRTKEQNQTNVRTNEKSQTEVRTNEKEGGPAVREKTDQDNGNQPQRGMKEQQRTEKQGARTEERNEGKQQAVGNGQEEKNRESSGSKRTEEKNAAGERNMNKTEKGEEKNAGQQNMNENQGQKEQRETNRTRGEQNEQQPQEKAKGKGKASPTP